MATIKQVAELAGGPPAPPSSLMNGTGSVSPATRARVLAAAAQLGYTPSHVARSLQRKSSRTLGLVLPARLWDERSMAILRGLVDGAAGAGYDLLLASWAGDEVATYTELHRSRRVEGMAILDVQQEDERVAAAHSLGVPYVCAGRAADDSPFVAIDPESGVVEALAHLIVLGHERIGLLTPLLELAR